MLDFDYLNQTQSANVQFFGPGINFVNIPRGRGMIHFFGWAGGGGGGAGLTGLTSTGRGGGGGGASSAVLSLMMPRAFLIADSFVVSVGRGGVGGAASGSAGTGGSNTTCSFDYGGSLKTFYFTGAGGGGAAGTTTTASGGTQGTAGVSSTLPFGLNGIWVALSSQTGGVGTTTAIGSNTTFFTAFLPAGCGGGGANTTNGAFAGGIVIGAGIVPTQPAGASGYFIQKPFSSISGCGGSGSAAGTGGTGGNGGPGTGGGGGGGGITGGPGGNGGGGGLYVVSF